jgi:hypothetical protein
MTDSDQRVDPGSSDPEDDDDESRTTLKRQPLSPIPGHEREPESEPLEPLNEDEDVE